MRRLSGIAILVCLFLGSPVFALVVRKPNDPDPRRIVPPSARAKAERLDPTEKTPAGEAARGFLMRHGGEWEFSFDTRAGRPVLVQGSGIPMIPGRGNSLDEDTLAGLPRPGGRITLETLEPLARAFIEANRSMLRPARGTLELDRRTSLLREQGRLASLYFQWSVDGVPVEDASVFVRLNSGNLTQFGAPLVGPVRTSTRPTISGAQALDILLKYTGDGELYRLRHDPELVLQPEDGPSGLEYRLVWRIGYRVHDRIESWEGRIDAHTGEIVGFRDTNAYGRVVGGVYPRTVFDQDETSVPLSFVTALVDGLGQTTDSSGRYDYSGGLALSGLSGPWFDTTCQGCSDPVQPTVQVDLGTGYLDFGLGGTDEIGNGSSTPADRNTFYHLNQIRRIGKKWLPTLTWMDNTMTSNVNIEETCNAFYNGSVNFFRSGGGCNNTGEIADVITHEWGHGLDLNTLAGDGATGEGTADVVALHLSHSPLVGPGFGDTGQPVRDLDPNGSRGLLTTSNISSKCPVIGTLGPLGFEVHCEGEIYGQTAWDLTQSLVAKHGYRTGWRTSERLFFTSLPDAGGYLANSSAPIYSAYLNADDDDGNLANGTPNAAEIYAAFDAHGIAGAQQPSSPECTRPAQPAVAVVPRCDRLDLTWNSVPGANQYEIFRGELRLEQALFPVASIAGDQTSFSDTEVAPGADYWYVVMAVDAAGCESTIENPVAAQLQSQPVLSIVAAAADDTPRGNRSGFPDPDEEVDLVLSIKNVGAAPAVFVSGTISTPTPNVTILDGRADWPRIDPGAVAENLDVLRFRANAPENVCGAVIEFDLLPAEESGCSAERSFFEIELGDQGVCDPTPACFVEPTFAGLESAVSGLSCAETALSWQPGATNCQNATISYNVYRSTDAAFTPSASSLIASGLTSTRFTDTLLDAGQTYHYIVRAFDSRSGEDGNSQSVSAVAAGLPDSVPPVFAGLGSAVTGAECGEVELSWQPALETCSTPVLYEIYRSIDPSFVPGPATRVATAITTSFIDAALVPDVDQTYVVRARDGSGNEDLNEIRVTAASGITDRIVAQTGFESGPEGWAATTPNDAATGNWEWGDPLAALAQPEDCAGGTGCWFTELAATLSDGRNTDIDDGTTTLLSRPYDMTGMLDPAVRYSRWFSNDQGAAPGEDPFIIEVKDDADVSWVSLETVGAGTPLAWVPTEIPFPAAASATDAVRFRFTASDLLNGSYVEAGIDDFALIDRRQGCNVCSLPVTPVGTILVDRSGDDVVLDWTADPASGTRFVVYRLSGSTFDEALRIGTTNGRSFVDPGAMLSGENLAYRVSAIDSCGNESALE